MFIQIFTTGGTIDKVYFDAKSDYQVGDPQAGSLLKRANVVLEYEVEPLLQMDSLDMTLADRQLIVDRAAASPHDRILITHGTDTVIETAKLLSEIPDKTIVLTGSLYPAEFRDSDAIFNIGCAITAVQLLPPGTYITINGRVFDPHKVQKNVGENRFDEVA